MSPTESNDASPGSGFVDASRQRDEKARAGSRFLQIVVGIGCWIGVSWYLKESLFLAALGSALLCGPMLLSPIARLSRGEARLYEILKPVAWLGVLAVFIIAQWPPSDWAHLEWNLFWVSYFDLLGLAFPVAAGVACFCLERGTSDEFKPDKLSSKWKAFRAVGLVGALWGTLFLLNSWSTAGQCSGCEGEGVEPYRLNLPLLPNSTDEGVLPIIFLTWGDGQQEETNTSVCCIECGGSGQDTIESGSRKLYAWKKDLDAGDAQAQLEFGLYLWEWGYDALPVKDDWREAKDNFSDEQRSAMGPIHWLELAAEQGHVDAHYYLGKLAYQETRDEPFNLDHLLKAAEQGHVMAQDVLAYMYFRGINGVERDLEEGARLCKLASESLQQYATAYQRLARFYSGDWGGIEDATRSTELYRRAALFGDSWSMQKVSSCYARGYGVEQDRAWAYAWGVMGIVFHHSQSWGFFGTGGLDVDGMTDVEIEAAREHTWELWELLRHVEIRRDIRDDILPVHPL